MIHFYLPLSWYVITVCLIIQAACLGVLGQCGYRWYASQYSALAQQPLPTPPAAGRGNPYRLMCMYAQYSNCQVLASTDGMTVYGKAASLVQFACRCYIAGIFFIGYRLHPQGIGSYFRLWVAV